MVAAAGLGLTAPAHAADLKVEKAPTSVKAGKKIQVAVASDADSCSLSQRKTKRTVKLGSGTKVRFVVKTSKRARPGRYVLVVRCGDESKKIRVKVKRGAKRATSKKLVAGKITAKVTGRTNTTEKPATSAPATTQPAPTPAPSAAQPLAYNSPEVEEHWAAVRPAFLRATGECTEWVAHKRLDIYERAEKINYMNWANAGYPGAYDMSSWATKEGYVQNAAAVGFTVNTVPAPNAIMVKFGEPGHVAYVETVAPDGSFTVTEMNAPQRGVVTTRTIPAETITTEGLVFVH